MVSCRKYRPTFQETNLDFASRCDAVLLVLLVRDWEFSHGDFAREEGETVSLNGADYTVVAEVSTAAPSQDTLCAGDASEDV